MNELKHLQLNEAKWNRWSEHVDGKGWLYDYLRKTQNSVISLLDLKENMNFLDIGCGTGYAVSQVAKLTNYKGSYFGVDLSSGMIEKAEKNFGDKENIYFIRSSSESIPLEDDYFDTIICTNSFHHYLHPDKAMNEIYRLLKVGGKIFILDPTADHWYIKLADKFIKIIEPQHVKIYSTEEFKNLMIVAGLKNRGYKLIYGKEKVQIGEK